MGIATTRYEERVLASIGQRGHAKAEFKNSQSIGHGGVLFAIPALISQGLQKFKELYKLPKNHYYGLESCILTLMIMALLRIKNPEQLKKCKPGELGRIIGLDRIPEVRCLREKIFLVSHQNQSVKLNSNLMDWWYQNDQIDQENIAFIYIDGHVRIYFGKKANLPAKYISRQKLCLSATSEYWVNDAEGLPIMMVIGELTEKLQTVIEKSIIPQLLENGLIKSNWTEKEKPQCCFVFDREAYDTSFFERLWNNYRIAIITYRKNVRDNWDVQEFKSYKVKVLNNIVDMQLCEKTTTIMKNKYREIRRLSKQGNHQTSIISTHPTLEMTSVAGRMFGRWSQENFFKYMIQDYDFDKMIQYGTEIVDQDASVVNPDYRKISYRIKKLREKINRLEAKFYPLFEKVIDNTIDTIPAISDKQMEYKTIIDKLKQEEIKLQEQRKLIRSRIKIKDMPDNNKYNKLKTESKIFMNIIKMICYRAETSLAVLISPYLSRADDEKRMVIKQILFNNADLIPDYQKNTLTVRLHSLSAPRFNQAANELASLLNDTQTTFPGTNLRMIFESSAVSFCEE